MTMCWELSIDKVLCEVLTNSIKTPGYNKREDLNVAVFTKILIS